ncbi:PspC domain-containing protein [Synechococcus sp. UW179A]|uniref:PspC domain-containing protein n=1 Tax=Synechococcus sp. UW179A TaxID=2575510 RepID=UPI0010BE5FA9|nr:PspC domain-containing protein [Synechococcus sp. UW179A]
MRTGESILKKVIGWRRAKEKRSPCIDDCRIKQNKTPRLGDFILCRCNIVSINQEAFRLMSLTRSRKNSVFAGVCSGLESSGYGSANVWRIIFVVTSFFYGVGWIAYLVMAFTVKSSQKEKAPRGLNRSSKSKERNISGQDTSVSSLNPVVEKPVELPSGAKFFLQGVGEDLVVFSDKVTITPRGALGFLSKGISGTKTIPFRSVTAIQFREAGSVFSGFIQFTLPGGNESRGGVFAAAQDENTFMFAGLEKNNEADIIRRFIDEQIDRYHEKPSLSGGGLAAELQELAALSSKGVLSEDEFIAAKDRLINRSE